MMATHEKEDQQKEGDRSGALKLNLGAEIERSQSRVAEIKRTNITCSAQRKYKANITKIRK
jgi:hypothetical protein